MVGDYLMKVSNINDYLQLAAALGVIVGLGLVGYEIRENNAIAWQQAMATGWTNWTELSASEFESDLAEARAKAMTNTNDLSLSEMIKLDSWLSAVMAAYEQDYAAIRLSGESPSIILDDIEDNAPYYFGNQFSRGWYLENKYWLSPEIVQVIDQTLESTPLGSDVDYFNRIEAKYP